MKSPRSGFLASLLVLTLVGSVVSLAMIGTTTSFASHTNVTVNVEGDDVSDTYQPDDSITISGVIDDVVNDEDVTLKFIKPNGSTEDTITSEEDDNGDFEESYDIPGTAPEGVWRVEAEYDGDKMNTYFIVDDEDDTITLSLDKDDGIYEAGDEVTISGKVDNEDLGEEDQVEITVLDPTNGKIVNEDTADLGDSGLDDNEFEYSFDLDNDADHGRYAVKVTYSVDDQEGSTLFEILDDDSGGSSNDFTGDDASDGDLTAQIEKDSYESGDNVAIEGSIDSYDSGDNEDLSVVVENPDGDEVDDYGDNNIDVENNGDFTYDFDLDNDADEGTYSVTMNYIDDEITMTFEVDNGGSGGSSGSSDLTVKLNKASYLAGETISVTGTVKDVADPEDNEVVSILLYKPGGLVVLSASKYVTPASSGAYTAEVQIPSSLEPDEGYKIVVSYLEDEVQSKFDITGVSSNPSDKITIQTDKTSYSVGNTAKISGNVPASLVIEGQDLLLRVDTPDGNPCRIDPVDIPSSGSFSYDLVLGGKCGVPGKYDVEATYAGQKGSTFFTLGGSGGAGASFGLSVAGKTYPIDYELSAGSLNSIFARPDDKKLVVNVNTDEDGKLTLVLPREVIDSIKDGKDTDFVVTVEDESGNLSTVAANEVENTDQARTVEIDYKGGAERIEIVGTQVVPEFGTIAVIALTIALLAVTIATGRFGNKLSLFRQ